MSRKQSSAKSVEIVKSPPDAIGKNYTYKAKIVNLLKSVSFWRIIIFSLTHLFFMGYSIFLFIVSMWELCTKRTQFKFFYSFSLVVSLIKMVASGVGFYALLRGRSRLIFVYIIILIVLLCIHLGFLIYICIRIKKSFVKLHNKDLIILLLQTSDVQVSELRYHCCGIYGWRDYHRLHQNIPNTCCGFSGSGYCKAAIYMKKKGCYPYLRDAIQTTLIPTRNVLIAVVLIETLVLLLILITNYIHKSQRSLENADSDISY